MTHRMRRVACAILLLSPVATLGCATNAELQSRAANELDCQVRDQKLVELDSRTRIISGCGQQATYVKDCAAQAWSFSDPCTWRLDSKATNADDPQPVAASDSSAASAEPPASADRARIPRSAVGFDFGMDAEAAQRTCETAAGIWQPKGSYFLCSKTPVDTGLALQSRLGFCGGRLCELILEGVLASESSTADASFLKLKNSMLSKYGPAQRIEEPGDRKCTMTPVSCARGDGGHFAAVWKYEEGEIIEVNLSGKNDGMRLGIRYHLMSKGMTLDESHLAPSAADVDASAF